MENPQHDVAFSFLSRSEDIVRKLAERLTPNLNVFASFNKQEALAGTDGLGSFRQIFSEQARLVVVLYQEGWGKSDWTRVEEAAIQERFLKKGWEWLLFIMVNDVDQPPVWHPENRIRLSLEQYGVEQAVGVIKNRVQSLGGQLREEDPVDGAKRLEREMAFRANKKRLFASEEGVQEARKQAENVHGEIRRLVEKVLAESHLKVEAGQDRDSTVVTTGRVSLVASWHPALSNMLEHAPFVIQELNGRVLLPEQRGKGALLFREPESLSRYEFDPDLTPDQGWCWHSCFAPQRHFTTTEVAKCFIHQLLRLIGRADKGEIPELDLLGRAR